MNKFIVTSEKFIGEVHYTYGPDNWIIGVEFIGLVDKVTHQRLCQTIPSTVEVLLNWRNKSENMRIEQVPPDLSFDMFWRQYNYKVGKKEAEKAWKNTSDGNKLIAVSNIAAYDKWCKHKGIAKVYPATYLNKERYHDDFSR